MENKKVIIRNVEPIKGLSKMDFYKKVKIAINADSFSDTERFINEVKFKSEVEVDENIVPHLKSAFTFSLKHDYEIEMENYYKTKAEKVKKASEWFETLTQEQKEFAAIMCACVATG